MHSLYALAGKLHDGKLGHLAPILEHVAHEMVELVEVAEARLDDAEELVAIRRQETLGLLATKRAERCLDGLDCPPYVIKQNSEPCRCGRTWRGTGVEWLPGISGQADLVSVVCHPPFAICVADGFQLGWLDDAAENDPIALCFSSEFFENERTDGNAVDE